MKRVRFEPSFDSWRIAARTLLQQRVSPADVMWDDGSAEALLPGLAPAWTAVIGEDLPIPTLPRPFIEIARRVAAHRESDRWELLYRVAFRIAFENRHLLAVAVDDDVHRLLALAQAVRRDLHKMHAFVRFRSVDERFVAWYRPDHRIIPLAAPFFVERFATMQWSILTPDESIHWDGTRLTFAPGVPRAQAPSEDELEGLWRTYYASTFNPARTNLKTMRAEMPSRFWRDLPELRELPRLLSNASARVDTMLDMQRDAKSAAAFLPASSELETLRRAAHDCEGCDLFRSATQTVFGEGPLNASVVLVGEQPGDQEDLQGHPFVGPAGEVLDRALREAGLDRSALYVTNAVKHFAFEERGKKRIHRTPRTIEVAACKPWLDAELRALHHALIVCLGATAARVLLGGRFRVTVDHGRFFQTRDGREVLATIHPSAVLRADGSQRDHYYAMLVADLSVVAARLAGS